MHLNIFIYVYKECLFKRIDVKLFFRNNITGEHSHITLVNWNVKYSDNSIADIYIIKRIFQS